MALVQERARITQPLSYDTYVLPETADAKFSYENVLGITRRIMEPDFTREETTNYSLSITRVLNRTLLNASNKLELTIALCELSRLKAKSHPYRKVLNNADATKNLFSSILTNEDFERYKWELRNNASLGGREFNLSTEIAINAMNTYLETNSKGEEFYGKEENVWDLELQKYEKYIAYIGSLIREIFPKSDDMQVYLMQRRIRLMIRKLSTEAGIMASRIILEYWKYRYGDDMAFEPFEQDAGLEGFRDSLLSDKSLKTYLKWIKQSSPRGNELKYSDAIEIRDREIVKQHEDKIIYNLTKNLSGSNKITAKALLIHMLRNIYSKYGVAYASHIIGFSDAPNEDRVRKEFVNATRSNREFSQYLGSSRYRPVIKLAKSGIIDLGTLKYLLNEHQIRYTKADDFVENMLEVLGPEDDVIQTCDLVYYTWIESLASIDPRKILSRIFDKNYELLQRMADRFQFSIEIMEGGHELPYGLYITLPKFKGSRYRYLVIPLKAVHSGYVSRQVA